MKDVFQFHVIRPEPSGTRLFINQASVVEKERALPVRILTIFAVERTSWESLETNEILTTTQNYHV